MKHYFTVFSVDNGRMLIIHCKQSCIPNVSDIGCSIINFDPEIQTRKQTKKNEILGKQTKKNVVNVGLFTYLLNLYSWAKVVKKYQFLFTTFMKLENGNKLERILSENYICGGFFVAAWYVCISSTIFCYIDIYTYIIYYVQVVY